MRSWIEGTLQLSLGGVVDGDHMRQSSLNNKEVDGKTRYVALYRLQEFERESISTSTPQHGRCAIQMVFISPVKGEHMQPFYMVKSNIEPTVHA